MANNIDLINGQPKFKTLVEKNSTLADAYEVSVQADAAADKVRGATQGVFGVMRYNLVQDYMSALQKANGEKSAMDLKAIIGDFLLKCEKAEKAFTLPSSATAKTWTQAKSDLKTALEMGYPFDENQECGSSAMKKWCKDVRDAEKKAKEEAALEEARQRQQNAANDSKEPASEEGGSASASASASSGNKSGNDAGTDAGGKSILDGLTSEQQKVMLEAIHKLTELNKKDQQKADNVLGSFANTVASSFRKAFAKLAKAS